MLLLIRFWEPKLNAIISDHNEHAEFTIDVPKSDICNKITFFACNFDWFMFVICRWFNT